MVQSAARSLRPANTARAGATAPTGAAAAAATQDSGAAATTGPRTPGAASPRDGFGRGGPSGYRGAHTTTAPTVAADPALLAQAQGNRASHHLRQRRAPQPRVADGRIRLTSRRGASEATQARQAAFRSEMQAAGVTASNPPTEAQLTEYFGTFNSRENRSNAVPAYDRYSRAFHVHAAEAYNDSNADVTYSPEEHYGVRGRLFDNRADAERHARRTRAREMVTLPTADASSWRDISRTRQHDGRRVQDCEGFAFMSERLLGAAGYRSEQVANTGSRGRAHAMTLLRNPDNRREVVATSNGRAFTARRPEQALTAGWNHATGNDGSRPGRFYRGASQAEAQSRMMLARGD